jgi:hypothetical protein
MAKIAFLKKFLPETVKNGHFSPFFGLKTPFFDIFWHPENPPSKTPFLAVLPPGLRERPPGPERSFQVFPTALSDREGVLLRELDSPFYKKCIRFGATLWAQRIHK